MGTFYCAENRPMKKQWVYKKEERANTSPKFELTTFSSIFLLDISYMTYRKKDGSNLKLDPSFLRRGYHSINIKWIRGPTSDKSNRALFNC